ncbi:EVE domain-containing protein [Pseudoclavibacter sp. RFBG4]|uniref:EVE domain-containing protein n=1 Tax=Pseudoclavibacter sp. RFBG4 TaxID=2080575 RepID=UPI000CE73435|nr:EVE domain-containing protein [Pseudoclavibacter sp. RFBG4]PPG30923.1 EVE domain-containing protein [Pseudoclavibacter sp. RFBG4]
MAIRYWLVVQPFDRALAMVEGGFVQAPWGALEGVEQMRVSDGVTLYCPREVNPDGEPLRSVVQAGYVLDDEPYRAGGRGSSPWRREVQWMREARPALIRPLRDLLDLTRNDKYWGERLRAGWLELSRRDFEIFEDAVRRPSPEPSALGMGLIRETGLTQSEPSGDQRDRDQGEDPYSIRF